MKEKADEIFQDKDELLKQLADTKLKLALLMQQETETENLMANANSSEDKAAITEEDSFFASTQGRAFAHIKAQLRKQKARCFLQRDVPRIARVAASALLVFYIGLTTAVAAVPSVRISLMRMLYKVEEQYTEVSFQPDDGTSFDVPTEWVSNYFMSYIPDGYTFMLCSEPSTIEQEIIYGTSNGKLLRFCESSLETAFNLDTEGFSIRPIQINGSVGFIANNGETAKIVWATSDRCFTISIDDSAEEATQIAEKIVRIK